MTECRLGDLGCWSRAALVGASPVLRCATAVALAGGTPSGAVAADVETARFLGQPALVVHKEALAAGELVGLLGQYLDGQVLTGQTGQVGTRQLEVLRRIRFVDVHDA